MDSSSASSEEDDLPRAGLGGARRPISTPAFRPQSPPSQRSSSSSQFSSSDDDQPAKTGLPSHFGGAKARFRKRRRTDPQRGPKLLAQPAQTAQPKPSDPADWERHTRGIGSKILAKHGFSGRLGKREDGIAAPIQAVLRPEKLGLGAGSFLEKGHAKAVEETVQIRDRETAHADNSWRKNVEKGRASEKGARQKIVDMRDANPREVEDISAALKPNGSVEDATQQTASANLFAAPEILYNLRMLADAARTEVAEASRRAGTESLIMQTTRSESAKAKTEMEEARSVLVSVTELEELLNRLKDYRHTEDAVQFEEAVNRLVQIVTNSGDKSFAASQLVAAAVSDVVSERVEYTLEKCLARTLEVAKADRKLARHLYVVLTSTRNVLTPEHYTRLCTRSVLIPLRRHMSRPGWDVVKGACLGDVLSVMRRALPEAVLHVFTEDVLVPTLIRRLRMQQRPQLDASDFRKDSLDHEDIPSHVWIHPWLPVTGRRALVEVLHHVRVELTMALQRWELSDSSTLRSNLVALVKTWSKVLSRRKLQLALSRHVNPKLASGLKQIKTESADASRDVSLFDSIAAWAEVCSARLLAADLSSPFIRGPGTVFRNVAFADEGWERAKKFYLMWKGAFPDRLRETMRPAFAALLFMLHTARVERDPATRQRLRESDPLPLLNNRFVSREKSDAGKTARAERAHPGRKREGQKAQLGDVLVMVAEREGLSLVGLGDERGMRVFKLGQARVMADVGRGVLVVGGRAVGVEELVKLAKGG